MTNQLLSDRSDTGNSHFAQQPLDVIFFCVAKTAMCQHGVQARFVTGARAKEFRRVCFRAARLASVIEVGRARCHEVS